MSHPRPASVSVSGASRAVATGACAPLAEVRARRPRPTHRRTGGRPPA